MTRRRDLALPPIVLDRRSEIAVYLQLADQLTAAIRRHSLDGARLPSTRVLASLLRVSRNTVLAAYDELGARGLIEARRGSGTRVPLRSRHESQGFATQSVLRAAQYPARTISLLDPDGVSLYLTY